MRSVPFVANVLIMIYTFHNSWFAINILPKIINLSFNPHCLIWISQTSRKKNRRKLARGKHFIKLEQKPTRKTVDKEDKKVRNCKWKNSTREEINKGI